MSRLINADAFCDEMRNRQNECAKWRDETNDEDIKIRADGALSAFIECKLTLDKMPTIEERKKGKWKERGVSTEKVIDEWQSVRCSVCGLYHTTPYLYYFQHYNYCPNCGARIEKNEM